MMFRTGLAGMAVVVSLSGCGPKVAERTPERPAQPGPRPAVASVSAGAGPAWNGVVYAPRYDTSACRGAARSQEAVGKAITEAVKDEAEAIGSTKGRVRREGDVLAVGAARFQNDASDGDSFARYTYLGRLADLPYDVVAGAHWEWSTWTVVDAAGHKVALSGPPVPSPGGKAFAAAGDDQMGMDFNGLQIVEARDGKFVTTELDAPYACDPIWKGADVVEVKILPGAVGDHEGDLDQLPASAWIMARAIRDGSGWKLVR